MQHYTQVKMKTGDLPLPSPPQVAYLYPQVCRGVIVQWHLPGSCQLPGRFYRHLPLVAEDVGNGKPGWGGNRDRHGGTAVPPPHRGRLGGGQNSASQIECSIITANLKDFRQAQREIGLAVLSPTQYVNALLER